MDRSTKEPRRAQLPARRLHPHVQTLFTVDVDGAAGDEASHLPAFVRFHQAGVAGAAGALLGLACGLTVAVSADPSGVGSKALPGSTAELLLPARLACSVPSTVDDRDELVELRHFDK